MIIDSVVFVGGIVVLLLIFAESSHKKILGVMAALILILFGIGVAVDGVQVITGVDSSTSGNQTIIRNATTNETTVVVDFSDEAIYHYDDIVIPYVDFKNFFALIMIGLGLFSIMYYGLNILS